jgi:hypothetical protein
VKRTFSLALAALAYAGFPLWAHVQATQVAAAMERDRGWVCGLPIMGIYLFALFGAGAVSMVSFALGTWSFRGLAAPRPRGRIAELVVIALPMALALLVVALLVISGA